MRAPSTGAVDEAAAVAAYFEALEPALRERLEEVRQAARLGAPEAEEALRYGMPTLRQGGYNLVHYAVWAGHVGFYPGPGGVERFLAARPGTPASKGAVRLVHDQPLPLDTIREVTAWRVEQELARRRGASR